MFSYVLRHPRLHLPLRVAAGSTWVAVAALSIVSCQGCLRAGPSGDIELGTAFGFSALATRLAFRQTRSRWQLSAFAVAAVTLQLGKLCASAKLVGADDGIAGCVGALVGIVIARAVDHRSWRP